MRLREYINLQSYDNLGSRKPRSRCAKVGRGLGEALFLGQCPLNLVTMPLELMGT